jgi:hypothetical protein
LYWKFCWGAARDEVVGLFFGGILCPLALEARTQPPFPGAQSNADTTQRPIERHGQLSALQRPLSTRRRCHWRLGLVLQSSPPKRGRGPFAAALKPDRNLGGFFYSAKTTNRLRIHCDYRY